MAAEHEENLVEKLFGGVKEVALTVARDLGQELDHQVAAGAHELAAALFRDSSGFVMYQRGSRDDEPSVGVHGPAIADSQPELQQEKQQEREGMSM
jgi:hypothetical protein